MSFEKFKETEARDLPLGRLVGMVSRSYYNYLNSKFKSLNINPTQLSFLFEIKCKKNINQHDLSTNNRDWSKGKWMRTIEDRTCFP